MNQVTEDQKQSMTKTFAIVGFIALIIIAVWLAVNVVRIVPVAFSSLASIAESVANYSAGQPRLEVASEKSVINAGESVTVNWTKMRKPGTYSFSYDCTNGVSVDVRNTDGQIVSLTCGTILPLGSNTSADIQVASEKARFTDVAYTITFTPTDTTQAAIATTKSITIVNASIPLTATGTASSSVPVTTVTVSTPTSTPQTATKPAGNTPVAGKPTTIQKVIYTMPVSDPNGTVDLQMTYIGVGVLNGNVFIPTQNIQVGQQGAIRFAIKNIGTKTEDNWSFTAQLPSGATYTSGAQTPLKPNEQATITLGFRGISQTGFQKFSAVVNGSDDANANNNIFTWAVGIVN